MCKLALIQMRVEAGKKEANLDRARDLIGKAANEGARVAVLPEAMTLGWTHSSARGQADEIPNGASCIALRATARQHKLYLCSGLIEKAGQQIFNSAVLID